jgi:hypothetical protein
MRQLQGKSQIILHDETLRVVAQSGIKYVDGKAQALGPETLRTIVGNVQPVQGRDIELVPEGDQDKENLFVWTPDPIFLNETVERKGAFYHVGGVEDWGSYFMARIVRADVGPESN